MPQLLCIASASVAVFQWSCATHNCRWTRPLSPSLPWLAEGPTQQPCRCHCRCCCCSQVGYRIGQRAHYTSRTKIVFATAGMLLEDIIGACLCRWLAFAGLQLPAHPSGCLPIGVLHRLPARLHACLPACLHACMLPVSSGINASSAGSCLLAPCPRQQPGMGFQCWPMHPAQPAPHAAAVSWLAMPEGQSPASLL